MRVGAALQPAFAHLEFAVHPEPVFAVGGEGEPQGSRFVGQGDGIAEAIPGAGGGAPFRVGGQDLRPSREAGAQEGEQRYVSFHREE